MDQFTIQWVLISIVVIGVFIYVGSFCVGNFPEKSTLALYILIGVGISFSLYNSLRSKDQNIINQSYEAIDIVNNQSFDNLQLGPGFLNNKEVSIIRNLKYPEDKIVSVSIKGTLFYLNVENDEGKAKVVDVIVDGKQVIFKEF